MVELLHIFPDTKVSGSRAYNAHNCIVGKPHSLLSKIHPTENTPAIKIFPNLPRKPMTPGEYEMPQTVSTPDHSGKCRASSELSRAGTHPPTQVRQHIEQRLRRPVVLAVNNGEATVFEIEGNDGSLTFVLLLLTKRKVTSSHEECK